ncbi:MAG: helix-turn-helix domain-containing protein [Vicinamibacteria bacterium]
MAKTVAALLPGTEARLHGLGARLRLARLRRRLTAKQVAARAGMAPMTLRGLERGGTGVTMGAYLAVLQVLGLDGDLDLIAKGDDLGRDLQDARLPSIRVAVASTSPVARDVAGRNEFKPAAAPKPWDTRGLVSSEALARLLVPLKAESRKPRRKEPRP